MSTGSPTLKRVLAQVATGLRLSEDEARAAFDVIMAGEASPAQIGGLLMALRVRGETVEEIAGAARAMRARMRTIEAPPGAIDMCGTGGDASGTYNISTAATFVVAACGVPVAKHGNRAQSSTSGAADVLSALGVVIDADFDLVTRALHETGITFLMAQRHHSAMRHVAPVRTELGTRTLFNLLGPLCNPAGVTRQLVGVFAPEWVEPVAEVLKRLGSDCAWVVHGSGLDELTTAGPTQVAELKDGTIRRFQVTPADAGLAQSPLSALKGGDATVNAEALRGVLAGHPSPYRDVVVLNAAAALVVAGKADTLRAGASLAASAIDSGAAAAVLERFAALSRTGVAA